MDVYEKTELLNELFSIYQSLLTEKQKEYFELYYHMDLSLQEIAEQYSVSRNAIYDQLKSVEEHLHNYENKLEINNKRHKRYELLNKYVETGNKELLNELRKLDE